MHVNADFLIQYLRIQMQPSKGHLTQSIICLAAPENSKLIEYLNTHETLITNFLGIPEFLDSGRKSWTVDSRRWTLDSGLWTQDAGLWTLDSGL